MGWKNPVTVHVTGQDADTFTVYMCFLLTCGGMLILFVIQILNELWKDISRRDCFLKLRNWCHFSCLCLVSVVCQLTTLCGYV